MRGGRRQTLLVTKGRLSIESPLIATLKTSTKLKISTMRHVSAKGHVPDGGRYRDRTCDPFHVKEEK